LVACGFGAVPLLDAQYFIAGIIPTVILGSSAICIYFLHLLVYVRYPGWTRGLTLKQLLVFHGILLCIGITAGLIVWFDDSGKNGPPSVHSVLSMLVVLAVSVLIDPPALSHRLVTWFLRSARMAHLSARDRDWFKRWVRGSTSGITLILPLNRSYVIIVPLLAGMLLTWRYIDDIYPNVPQALGGAAPRCARLDLAAQRVSSTTLNLLGVPETGHSAPVATTPELLVHRETGAYTLVSAGVGRTSGARMIQIRSEAVQVLSWCD
jgi:hypothetical protein